MPLGEIINHCSVLYVGIQCTYTQYTGNNKSSHLLSRSELSSPRASNCFRASSRRTSFFTIYAPQTHTHVHMNLFSPPQSPTPNCTRDIPFLSLPLSHKLSRNPQKNYTRRLAFRFRYFSVVALKTIRNRLENCRNRIIGSNHRRSSVIQIDSRDHVILIVISRRRSHWRKKKDYESWWKCASKIKLIFSIFYDDPTDDSKCICGTKLFKILPVLHGGSEYSSMKN